MPNTRLPNSILFMLVVLSAVQSAYYTPRIPEILGSHFAKGGAVNAWQTKTAFFSTELAIIVLATVVSFGIPRIIAGMPVSVINLPHKEFWLSPERRDDTLSYIRVWSAWIGCALLPFFAFRNGVSLPRQLAHPTAAQHRCLRDRYSFVPRVRRHFNHPPNPPLLEDSRSLTVPVTKLNVGG
jgi:hypothetical protein